MSAIEQVPGFQYPQANYNPLRFPNPFLPYSRQHPTATCKGGLFKKLLNPSYAISFNLSWSFIQTTK